MSTAEEIGQRTDLTLAKNGLKLDTADDIGDRKSKGNGWPLKTTADEIEEEYTVKRSEVVCMKHKPIVRSTGNWRKH